MSCYETIVLPGREAIATVKWFKQAGNNTYICRGTGGYDPDYYHDYIEIVTNGSRFDDPSIIPPDQIWVGIAGASSGNPEEFVGYLNGRFQGFSWEVEVIPG